MTADDAKKTQPPAPAVPRTAAQTPAAGKAAPTPRAPVTHYPPDPDIPTSTEWANENGPPVTPEPAFGYGSKRVDIFPRVPFDPTNFLNLQASSTGDFLVGLPGMIADKGEVDKISRVPETDIPFGAPVAVGETGDGYCKLATAAADKILGIAMRDLTSQGGIYSVFGATPGSTEVFPKDHYAVPIITRGRVWVLTATAVHEGDPVGFSTAGAFQTGGTAIAGAKWVTSAPAGMLAQVSVNLP